jgi:hypothetical protein
MDTFRKYIAVATLSQENCGHVQVKKIRTLGVKRKSFRCSFSVENYFILCYIIGLEE